MDIEKEITKEVFEKYVPAAKMPERNDSVYKRIVPFFAMAAQRLKLRLFGDDFENLMDSDTFKQDVLQWVCQWSFVQAMSSLDLVLTGTGFGIVSTNDTSPASQQRVKALKDDMQWLGLRASARILRNLTRQEGWGEKAEALTAIREFYFDPSYLEQYGPRDVSLSLIDNWMSVRVYRHSAEVVIAGELSREYYDEILNRLRTAKMTNADLIVYYHSLDFIAEAINAMRQNRRLPDIRRWGLRDYMERYITQFETYKASDLYAKLHGDHYKNSKNDPAFFFV